jgi:hypothetical protein
LSFGAVPSLSHLAVQILGSLLTVGAATLDGLQTSVVQVAEAGVTIPEGATIIVGGPKRCRSSLISSQGWGQQPDVTTIVTVSAPIVQHEPITMTSFDQSLSLLRSRPARSLAHALTFRAGAEGVRATDDRQFFH